MGVRESLSSQFVHFYHIPLNFKYPAGGKSSGLKWELFDSTTDYLKKKKKNLFQSSCWEERIRGWSWKVLGTQASLVYIHGSTRRGRVCLRPHSFVLTSLSLVFFMNERIQPHLREPRSNSRKRRTNISSPESLRRSR